MARDIRLTGYAWEAGGGKQVAYDTPDGHLQELWFTQHEGWHHNDLTVIGNAASEGMLVQTLGNGYDWHQAPSKQVVYMGRNGHVYELSFYSHRGWLAADWSEMAGAADPSVLPDHIHCAYSSNDLMAKYAVYVKNGHIHELVYDQVNEPTWQHRDLTEITGAPQANKYGWAFSADDDDHRRHVVYHANGRIHELSQRGDEAWAYRDLTGAANAPPAIFFYNAYNWQGSQHVIYVADDEHMHELASQWGTTEWQDADVSVLAGVTDRSHIQMFMGHGYGCTAEGMARQIVYLTPDKHIHELSSDSGSWQHADLTQIADAPLALGHRGSFAGYGWGGGGSRQVAYVSTDGHIYELSFKLGDVWQVEDLSVLTGAPWPGVELPGCANIFGWFRRS